MRRVMTRPPVAAILAAAARGDAWTGDVNAAVLADAQRHDVGPLLYRALRGSAAWDDVTDTVRDALRRIAVEAVFVDEARTAGDRDVIAAFADAGIEALVFKGAALAHRHYPEPWLRPRVDADLLIRARDRERAAAVCEHLGCVRAVRPDGEYATHQFTYHIVVRGVRLEYDIHWKIADPHVFADVLGFDELARESVPLPALGARARAIGDAHAWLVACTHRVAHHFDRDWLLFLYDIDLLSRRLDEAAWSRLVTLAQEKRIAAVCARSLALAMARLDTPVPAGVRDALEAADRKSVV